MLPLVFNSHFESGKRIATVSTLVTVGFSFDDEPTVNSQDELAGWRRAGFQALRLSVRSRPSAVDPRNRSVLPLVFASAFSLRVSIEEAL